ncbi:hypothetical protein ACFVMC_05805 [Nocardia sp. NPDC127579]|uniref:hypothetical protein n=1 Tax=Nocardia sp. NPDC127579 TaxID=3345402 RepID=UPI0036251A7E
MIAIASRHTRVVPPGMRSATRVRRRPAGRAVLGAMAGALVAALAIAAHGFGGGSFPDSANGTLLLVVAVLAGAVATALPTACNRFGLLGVLAAGQFAGHTVLSGFDTHHHEFVRAQLPGWWMLLAHVIATLVCGAVITLAQRLYLVVSRAIRAALAAPPRIHPQLCTIGWSAAGPSPYRFHPTGAGGPRAPPVAV